MKRFFITALMVCAAAMASAQTLENMQWFNEPEKWEIKNGRLQMDVTPQRKFIFC